MICPFNTQRLPLCMCEHLNLTLRLHMVQKTTTTINQPIIQQKSQKYGMKFGRITPHLNTIDNMHCDLNCWFVAKLTKASSNRLHKLTSIVHRESNERNGTFSRLIFNRFIATEINYEMRGKVPKLLTKFTTKSFGVDWVSTDNFR